MIKELLNKDIIITDGAMGTYYSEITGNDTKFCELANITNPEIITKIHREYILAGANLIRTNTFSANSIAMNINRDELSKIIESGYKIAENAVEGTGSLIGASIGPIRTSGLDVSDKDIIEEYKFIIDTFLKCNANIFIFETFSSLNYLKEVCKYIKDKNSNAFILTQFAVMPDGFTRESISYQKIVAEAKEIEYIDALGFNCGSGPSHLCDIFKKINIENTIFSALPNAGYPELISERTIYSNSPKYFATKMLELKSIGVKIIGGCCGTSPKHIEEIVKAIKNSPKEVQNIRVIPKIEEDKVQKIPNEFIEKLNNNEFVVAIELSPPFNSNVDKIIESAKYCKDNGIDLITVPDSPMSKVRADSFIISSKIKREVGIDVMPHICCRDKNVNAIRSSIIAGHIENVRNVLAITGDPVSDANKAETKSVFNLNSFKLIELLSGLNDEVLSGDKICIGGALNLNVRNKDIEIKRMINKIEKGAKFFLTQPIYEDSAIECLENIKKKYDVKILAGILPVVSYRNAQFLNNELPGVNIPDKYLNMFNETMSKEESQEIGINIALEIVRKVKDVADGLYFIPPFHRVKMIVDILNRL